MMTSIQNGGYFRNYRVYLAVSIPSSLTTPDFLGRKRLQGLAEIVCSPPQIKLKNSLQILAVSAFLEISII